MALKLDISKACDRLEWPFVVEVLSSMGFPAKLVNLIKRCISMVSYKILINNQPSRCFIRKRGLCQGDSLLSYLFIICVDVLSGLLKKKALEKRIYCIQVARQAPVITHLFFADDNLLFSRAICQEVDQIMITLKSYQLSSCQVVNLDKSEVSFS